MRPCDRLNTSLANLLQILFSTLSFANDAKITKTKILPLQKKVENSKYIDVGKTSMCD